MIAIGLYLLFAQAASAGAPAATVSSAADTKIKCELIYEAYSRICRAEAEWKRIADETDKAMKASQDQGIQCDSERPGVFGCGH